MKRFASDRVAGLMERMGLEEDVAIESRIVSRTIESAQSRVEGYNFDIRKRVVEYDDVINKQRETIYAERDKVLHNEDLTETVRTFLDQEIGSLVDRHLAGDDAGAWDVDGLAAAVNLLGLTGDGTSADELWDIADRSAIEQHLRDLADARLTALEEEHGADTWALVERIVLLRAIDALWVEHLTELDDMRRGIGLRGYSGEDPLNAFKKEAYSLYAELRDLIRHQVASTIFRVNVVRQEPAAMAQPLPGPGQRAPGSAAAVGTPGRRGELGAARRGCADGRGRGSVGRGGRGRDPGGGNERRESRRRRRPLAGPGGSPTGQISPALRGLGRDTTRELMQGTIDGARGQARPAGIPKLGRNDPCYCGSGLKYKKCHGR